MRALTLTLLAFLCVALVPMLAAPAPALAANCEFVLGFQTVHNLIPNIVGVCAESEHFNPANGDSLQQTTMPNGQLGLLVWRKADNWTAFTDGYHTWINGPNGIQERLNAQCLPWETACLNQPAGSTATTVTFTSVVGAQPGGTASVTVQTSPNTVCAIDYFGPLGADRYELGLLHRKTTDGNGVVTWSWPISTATALGTGTVDVACNGVVAKTGIPIGTTPITVAFTTVTGAAPGGTASATVHTSPFAVCAIDYFGPKGADRDELGALHRKQVDANGNVSWSWLIAPNTPAGNGTVAVSCEGVIQTTAIPIS